MFYSAKQYRALAGRLHKIFSDFEPVSLNPAQSGKRPKSLETAKLSGQGESPDPAESPDKLESSSPNRSAGG